MGGGASHGSIESLLSTTMMVGRAIANIYRNPGMYRLQDFHSKLAPRLNSNKQQNPFVFFGQVDDDEDEVPYDPPPRSIYEHLFHVRVNDESIYFDDVSAANEAGWTPLHACCMSFHTAAAGCDLIDELVLRGASLDLKTFNGPGTFNKGWTPLHMACAYNVEPLVDKLLASGADCNTMNSFGYSPLLEACHRGYLPVVEVLINAGASLTHVPPDEMSGSSPFAAAPAHSALGEAARCGFPKIVSLLLEKGAPANDTNTLGWTPLHEACFYNRRDVVDTLLSAGADATIRTQSGALPYHLSGLEEVRALIADKGSPKAIPAQGDTVNMLDILHEITMGIGRQGGSGSGSLVQSGESGARPMFTIQMLGDDEDEEDDEDDEDEVFALMQLMQNEMNAQFDEMDADLDQLQAKLHYGDGDADGEGEGEERYLDAKGQVTPGKYMDREVREYAEGDYSSEPALLHSGPLLGNLPSLAGTSSPESAVQRSGRDLGAALELGEKGTNADAKKKKAGKKKGGKKSKGPLPEGVPADMPERFLCQLSRRPMQEPMKSIYGNIFELTTIRMWFQQQGQICPLTGAPLVEADLKPLPELAEEIMMWVLNRSRAPAVEQPVATSTSASAGVGVGSGSGSGAKGEDDMYDF